MLEHLELHGTEHFIRGFGVPVRGPDDEVAGALCLSGRTPRSHAAAPLQTQLGALHLRNERPGDIVHEAEASLARLMRSARTWQLASGLHSAALMSLPEEGVEVNLLNDRPLLFRGRTALGSRHLDRCLR